MLNATMDNLAYLAAELKQHKDALQGFYYLMVGVFGVCGIYFLQRRTQALQKSSDASAKQAKLAEISQINDQYIKSIEQLGSKEMAIKLGGIYGLEQVAQSSDQFYVQVIEVFTAYLREYAVEPQDTENHTPRKDLQAILTVLGRANNQGRVVFDLSEAYLARYTVRGDFTKADCWGTNFTQANCIKANFTKAYCLEANFTQAYCEEANFTEAKCWEADFTEAKCGITNFTEAYCWEADFTEAYCWEANFTKANCRQANFTRANCWGANFTNADCTDANFTNASIDEAIGLERPIQSALAGTAKEDP